MTRFHCQISKLGNENPIHKVKILNTYPEIANSIRRTLTSYFDSCAFPDTTIKEISKTREMPYFADTYITPYVEQLLRLFGEISEPCCWPEEASS